DLELVSNEPLHLRTSSWSATNRCTCGPRAGQQRTAAPADLELVSNEPLHLRTSSFIVGIEEMPVRFTHSKPSSPNAS
ncbi:MAG: hypothetical protein QF890_18500, partial [Myxococcota bacterium]|nr:hypothetical protein [Myxococcota bacterium]